MEDFPSNSQRQKSKDKKVSESPKAEKNVQSVVTTPGVRRKKPLSRRFADAFLGGTTENVGSYVFFDVMVPALKDLVVDAGETALRRMIIGEDARPRSRSARRPSSNVSYNSRYRNNPVGRAAEPDERPLSNRARARHDFDEIILATRAEADDIIEQMFELLSKFDVVTVEDMYELAGVTAEFTDAKWGWEDLRGSRVVRTSDGYLLDLPRPIPIR